MQKKIKFCWWRGAVQLLAVMGMFVFVSAAHANINIDADVVGDAIGQYVSAENQVAALGTYVDEVKASNGAGISAMGLYRVCVAAGWDIAQSTGHSKCQEFVGALLDGIGMKLYAVCTDDGRTAATQGGAKTYCVDDFFTNKYVGGTRVQLITAIGLAQEYARVKNGHTVKCSSKDGEVRQICVDPMCVAKDWGIRCGGLDSGMVNYEFIFNDIDSNIDIFSNDSIQDAVCRMHGTKYQAEIHSGDAHSAGKISPAMCAGANAATCQKINDSFTRFGFTARFNGNQCEIEQNRVDEKDLKTAFGIDNRVFRNGYQVKGTPQIIENLKKYTTAQAAKYGETIRSFRCADAPVQMYTSDGTDDVLRCWANDKPIDFVFDDLSESWGAYDRAGRQGMDCVVSGGTYTGRQCSGLDKTQCYVIKKANAESCPECQSVRWNTKTNVCELPDSVTASNLRRGLTYTAIVGGVAASVVVTVGTLGAAAGAASPGIVLLLDSTVAGAEVVGGVIELTSQVIIDNTADNFFVDSANCNSAECATELVKKYLIELARQQNDLEDPAIEAVDAEMARLLDLIPTNSDWWIDQLKNEDGSSFLENADDGRWTTAQIWRAVGIGMQFTGVASAVVTWVVKHAVKLSTKLSRTSAILLRNAKIAKQNIVDYDKLDDIGKEWYRLWREYAPRNQTLAEFKEMADGDLEKMKQMTNRWPARSKRGLYNQQLDKQMEQAAAELNHRYTLANNLMKKYNIDGLPTDPTELAELYAQYPDLERALKNWGWARQELSKLENAKVYYNGTAYSTYDPEFTRISKEYKAEAGAVWEQLEAPIENAWQEYIRTKYPNFIYMSDKEKEAVEEAFFATREYVQITEPYRKVLGAYQYEIAEKYPLKNLGNVVNERADEFMKIINENPDLRVQLYSANWDAMSNGERADIAQRLLDEYAASTHTPQAVVELDYNTNAGGYHTPGRKNITYNPNAQFRASDGMIEVGTHEHGHFLDEWAPNEGALGEQFAHYSSQLYSNQADAGYRVALGEQSSYSIGSETAQRLSGADHRDVWAIVADNEQMAIDAEQMAIDAGFKKMLAPTMAAEGSVVYAGVGGTVATKGRDGAQGYGATENASQETPADESAQAENTDAGDSATASDQDKEKSTDKTATQKPQKNKQNKRQKKAKEKK